VVLTVPAGAHLKAAFMAVALPAGTPGTLRATLPPTDAKDELGDGVWHGRVTIPLNAEGLPARPELVVTYQPCTEGPGGVCYPPKERILPVDGTLIPGASGRPPAGPLPRNLLWIFLGVFGAGLLASLTPCVYPMIPITMAIIGAKGGGRARGLALSAALVLGMATTYTALGVLAARTGATFGAFAQSAGFLIPVSILFALFAVSLLGGFEISLPDALVSRLQGSGPRQGLAGAFCMGLVLGPISAPCVGPVIGTVLVAIAQEGKVLLGAAELFTFALGMGVLFLVVGTFSAALPRSGDWLVRLKRAMGLVVLGFAVWNLRLVVPLWLTFGLWSLVMCLTASILGAFRPALSELGGYIKALGLLALALGVLLGLRAVEAGLGISLLQGPLSRPAQAASQGWMEQDLEGALARAKATGKPALVDTYADWCAQCKELDESTWPDPQVAAWIQANAVAVRIDTFKVRKDLAAKLGILSYPTAILLDADGRELRRILGYQPPAEMLKFLKG
jgi:thiol:disulfide interchange protein DsbD